MNTVHNATHADVIIHNTLRNGLPLANMVLLLALAQCLWRIGGSCWAAQSTLWAGSVADEKSAERFVHTVKGSRLNSEPTEIRFSYCTFMSF